MQPILSALTTLAAACVVAVPAAGAPGDRTLDLVSTPGARGFDAEFQGSSADGSRAWFTTQEPIPGLGDTDASHDLYERAADGRFRLLSIPGAGAFGAFFAGASSDGSRVWFETAETSPGLGDADGGSDLYERAATGGLRLLSTSGGGAFGAFFAGASSDGSRVWFETAEPNASLGDTDARFDVYERDAGGVRLVSTAGAAAFDAFFSGASSDGSRVWFSTRQPNQDLEDRESGSDVYERPAGGGLRLVTTPGLLNFDATFRGGSSDGSRVWFETTEPNASLGDTDARIDVYERVADGGLRLVSTLGAGAFDATFRGASSDGSRVWFDATFRGASSDGSRVWFQTSEPNPQLGDTDARIDVYESRWGAPGNLSAPTVTGIGRVGQALTCAPGTWAGDGFTLSTEWLRDDAAIDGQAGSSYTVTGSDGGAAVACRVSARNLVGSAGATSAPIAIARTTGRAVTMPPRLLRPLRVRGPLVRGGLLTCDRSGIVAATDFRVSWRRDGRRAEGRGARYRIGRADLGRRIACRVIATGPGGSLTATSRARLIPVRCRAPGPRALTLSWQNPKSQTPRSAHDRRRGADGRR